MSHRFNLFMSAVANIIWTLGQVFVLSFLFEKIDTFDGWVFGELVLLLAFMQVFFYSYAIIYSSNLERISRNIIRGDFDRTLTKPINLIFQVSFEEVSIPQIIPMFVTVFPLIIYGFSNLSGLNNLYILQAFIVLFFSLILIYFFCVAVSGLAFFVEKGSQIKDILINGVANFNQVPLTIFPNFVKYLTTIFIPVGFISFYPVAIIKGLYNFEIILFFEIILILFWILIMKIIWKAGLRRYSGVG